VKFELPARGDNTLAKKADTLYAKVLTHDTIGLSGVTNKATADKMTAKASAKTRAFALT